MIENVSLYRAAWKRIKRPARIRERQKKISHPRIATPRSPTMPARQFQTKWEVTPSRDRWKVVLEAARAIYQEGDRASSWVIARALGCTSQGVRYHIIRLSAEGMWPYRNTREKGY